MVYKSYMKVKATSLKNFNANVDVIFYVSLAMFSYISMNFIFSQYRTKKEEKNRKGKRKAF